MLSENNFAFVGLDNGYIETIKELTAKDNTANSGWMYMVNGKHPEVGLNDYVLSDKDVITWHWTDDFRLEEGAEHMNAERVTEYVENLISAASSSEEARKKARDAYDKLTKEEQDTIKNYQKLKDAEENAKKAEKVIDLINDIGPVTKDSKKKIEKARKAYDDLTENQKKLIPKEDLKTLEDAEAAYAELVKSNDAGVKEIKLGNIKAKAEKNNTFTLEIPYSENASLPKDQNDFTIILADSKAGVTTAPAPVKEGDYSKWRFTVTAEDGTTTQAYTLNVSIASPSEEGGNSDNKAPKTGDSMSTAWLALAFAAAAATVAAVYKKKKQA